MKDKIRRRKEMKRVKERGGRKERGEDNLMVEIQTEDKINGEGMGGLLSGSC